MPRKFKKGDKVKCQQLIDANPDWRHEYFHSVVVRNLPNGLVEVEGETFDATLDDGHGLFGKFHESDLSLV